MAERAAVVVGDRPDALLADAAAELCTRLGELFGVEAAVTPDERAGYGGYTFVLGDRADAHVHRACAALPDLSDQGHLLRRLDERRLLLAGGSAAAACWAVYELLGVYGVEFLLHGDVLPSSPGAFHLPPLDRVLEPALRLRSWRQFNDLPIWPGLWSQAQQRAFIRQIFKLKYNGVYVCLWPHHPFVDFQIGRAHV